MKWEIIFMVKRFTEHLKMVKINDFHFLNLVCIYMYMYIRKLPELRVVNNFILNTVSRVCHSNSIYLLLENRSYPPPSSYVTKLRVNYSNSIIVSMPNNCILRINSEKQWCYRTMKSILLLHPEVLVGSALGDKLLAKTITNKNKQKQIKSCP